MDETKKTWQEPSPDRLAQALDSYSHVIRGGEPRSPIENGLKLLTKVEEQQNARLGTALRTHMVNAMARAMDVDAELPKARVSSLMAARMLAVDVSIQRDATMASGMDLLDRGEWWKSNEVAVRRPVWSLAGSGISDKVRRLDEDGLNAVASGEFHALPENAGAKLKADMEKMRVFGSPARRDLDMDILQAAGGITSGDNEKLKSHLGSSQGLDVSQKMILEFSRKAEKRDEASWPDPHRDRRESPIDTSRIAMRESYVRIGHMHPAIDPLKVDDMKAARAAVSDASLTNPDTAAGLAVRVARGVLTEVGADPALSTGEGFERIAALAFRETMSNATGEPVPGRAASYIVSMTLMREDAAARAMHAGMKGDPESKEDRIRLLGVIRDASTRNSALMLGRQVSGSPRDVPDVRRIAEGRFDRLSDDTMIRSSLMSTLHSVAEPGSRIGQMVSGKMEENSTWKAYAPSREAETRAVDSMSKGPETGRDLVADAASFAKGFGSASR